MTKQEDVKTVTQCNFVIPRNKYSRKKDTLFQDNCKATWEKNTKKYRNISELKLPWLGKISAKKLNVLPKINFLFQMLPIKHNKNLAMTNNT